MVLGLSQISNKALQFIDSLGSFSSHSSSGAFKGIID